MKLVNSGKNKLKHSKTKIIVKKKKKIAFFSFSQAQPKCAFVINLFNFWIIFFFSKINLYSKKWNLKKMVHKKIEDKS